MTHTMAVPRVAKVWLSGFVSILVGVPPGTDLPEPGDTFADRGVEFIEECPASIVACGLRESILSGVFFYKRGEDGGWVSTGEALSAVAAGIGGGGE